MKQKVSLKDFNGVDSPLKCLLPLALVAAVVMTSCSKVDDSFCHEAAPEYARVAVNAAAPGFGWKTRSTAPDENRVSDLNVLVFNSKDELEYRTFIPSDGNVELKLLKNSRYAVYVCANLGYDLGVSTKEELLSFRYHLSRDDDFRLGCPMTGLLDGVQIGSQDKQNITIPLERALARVRVRIDRSRLNSFHEFIFKNISLSSTPRSVCLFSPSRTESTDDAFSSGFSKKGFEVDVLNEAGPDGMSPYLELYMLENLQGDKLNPLCSYVELHADYESPIMFTPQGKSLVYRFYLGNDRKDFNVERNRSYDVTIIPEGDGLSGTGVDDGRGDWDWRIDKTELLPNGPAWVRFYNDGFQQVHVGETLKVWAEYFPPWMYCRIDEEYLELDRERGIYDYQLSEDGSAVTLNFLKTGTGLFHFDVGEPLDTSRMVLIEVLP